MKAEKAETRELGTFISALMKEGYSIKQDAVVGGASSDAVVTSPAGRVAMLEFKKWEPSAANIRRASDFAGLLVESSGADEAFVFLPGLTRNRPTKRVFSSNDPAGFVDYFASLKLPPTHRRKPIIRRPPRRSIFAAMPFAKLYDDTYLVAIQPAALAADTVAVRIDHLQFAGDVVAEIRRQISQCRAVVADLSEARPNVLFEVGFAQALGRPVIQISSSPLGQLPFDVRGDKTIPYAIGQTSSLRPKLVRAIKAALK